MDSSSSTTHCFAGFEHLVTKIWALTKKCRLNQTSFPPDSKGLGKQETFVPYRNWSGGLGGFYNQLWQPGLRNKILPPPSHRRQCPMPLVHRKGWWVGRFLLLKKYSPVTNPNSLPTLEQSTVVDRRQSTPLSGSRTKGRDLTDESNFPSPPRIVVSRYQFPCSRLRGHAISK